MPGLIDHARGICRYSPLLGWNSVDVARILEEYCAWRVYVDNDVNMVTRADGLWQRKRYGDGACGHHR